MSATRDTHLAFDRLMASNCPSSICKFDPTTGGVKGLLIKRANKIFLADSSEGGRGPRDAVLVRRSNATRDLATDDRILQNVSVAQHPSQPTISMRDIVRLSMVTGRPVPLSKGQAIPSRAHMSCTFLSSKQCL